MPKQLEALMWEQACDAMERAAAERRWVKVEEIVSA